MKCVVYSSKDVAGQNIAEALISKGFEINDSVFEGNEVFQRENWELIQTDVELIYAEHLNDLNYEEVIFASRHSAASGKPTLTAHACGNFGEADYGGQKRQISKASANTMCNIFREMASYKGEHEVSLEVTHHGPFIDIPHCWIELGSNTIQWKDKKAADFLADCIIKGIDSEMQTPSAIGIGGNHYAATFSKYEGEYAFGHIIPKYAQKYLNLKIVKQMIEMTFPEPEFIAIDKKGVAQQSKVQELVKNLGKEVILL